MFVWLCVCVFVCLFVCLCVCLFGCVFVCLIVCVGVSEFLQGENVGQTQTERQSGPNSSVFSLPGAACLFFVSSVSKCGHQTAKETRMIKIKVL